MDTSSFSCGHCRISFVILIIAVNGMILLLVFLSFVCIAEKLSYYLVIIFQYSLYFRFLIRFIACFKLSEFCCSWFQHFKYFFVFEGESTKNYLEILSWRRVILDLNHFIFDFLLFFFRELSNCLLKVFITLWFFPLICSLFIQTKELSQLLAENSWYFILKCMTWFTMLIGPMIFTHNVVAINILQSFSILILVPLVSFFCLTIIA